MTTFHTAPEFRALLLELASDPPQLDALAPLANWLEERGDERAKNVRFWEGEDRYVFAACVAVLAGFPEGPRWEVHCVANKTYRDGQPYQPPVEIEYRSCLACIYPPQVLVSHPSRPIWPDPPA